MHGLVETQTIMEEQQILSIPLCRGNECENVSEMHYTEREWQIWRIDVPHRWHDENRAHPNSTECLKHLQFSTRYLYQRREQT